MVAEPKDIIRLCERMGFPWDGSVAVSRKDRLPAKSGIYFVVRGDSLLYVGGTFNMRMRWRSHHRAAQFQPEDRIGFALYPFDDLGEAELLAIELLEPSLNRTPISPPVECTPETAAMFNHMFAAKTIEEFVACFS